MPVEAQPYALTTVAEFLGYLGEPPDTQGKQRDKAQRLINAYSAAIRRYIKRQLLPSEDGTEKTFAYTGNGFLSLAPFEARAINAVTLHTDLAESAWVVLANQSPTQEAQWRAGPRHRSEQGTYWYLQIPELGPYHPYYDEPITSLTRRNLGYQVTVDADWGVAAESDVPDDVELALWIACANAWRNPEGYQSRRLGPLAATDYQDWVPGTEEGLSLPRASRALLSGYRRRTGVR
jgi:hypothetical protein